MLLWDLFYRYALPGWATFMSGIFWEESQFLCLILYCLCGFVLASTATERSELILFQEIFNNNKGIRNDPRSN